MGKNIADALLDFIRKNDDMCIFRTDLANDYEILSGKITEGIISSDREPLGQICGCDRIHPSDKLVVNALCTELLKKSCGECDKRYSLSFRADLSDNDKPCYRCFSLSLLVDKDEEEIKCVIGELRLMNSAELLNRAIIDSFTNDKHPQVFASRAKKVLENNEKCAIVQFDIEKFKLINVRYGEEKGNEILNFITNGLDGVCTNDQVHIRLTADVFMIAMGYEKEREITELIEKITDVLGKYEDIKYKLVFGINIVKDKTLPIRKMGDRAALARQSIKGNALENIAYYKDEQESGLISRKYIEDRMYYALENGEFVMFLQPKYSISSERIIGSEALVRWFHPDKGIIPPMEFIPVFEQNGFIIKLDEYMWEQACKTIRSWIDMKVHPYPISVNISRVHLSNDSFIDVLDGLVEKYNIPRFLLETEITETVENDGCDEVIRKLKDRGYVLLMDDFGSGYSSLNMLKKSPFDIIKIDRQFFSEFMLSDRGKKIISHTIDMSKDIGIGMVAEGVETKEQSEFLHKCGCDVAQGYFYSKPVSIEEFNKLAYNM